MLYHADYPLSIFSPGFDVWKTFAVKSGAEVAESILNSESR
jgi:hypothetical protein